MYKRINSPLMKNGTELFAVGDTCNEIIGEASNWEEIHKGIFIPEIGERYYYVDGDGLIDTELNHDSLKARFRISVGNCYHTREEAKEALWRMRFETNMRKEFKPEECNWNNPDEHKFFIMYSYSYKKIVVNCSLLTQYQGTFYCNDREVVERFVEDNMDELRRYYGVK